MINLKNDIKPVSYVQANTAKLLKINTISWKF